MVVVDGAGSRGMAINGLKSEMVGWGQGGIQYECRYWDGIKSRWRMCICIE
jgi:hypothetical protein